MPHALSEEERIKHDLNQIKKLAETLDEGCGIEAANGHGAICARLAVSHDENSTDDLAKVGHGDLNFVVFSHEKYTITYRLNKNWIS